MPIEGVWKCLPTLKKLAQAKTKKERNQLLKKAKSCIYYSISDISKNTLNGNIPINSDQKREISKYTAQLRRLARKSKVPLKERKKLVLQTGGAFLPALLLPAISFLGGKLAEKIL